MKGLQKVTEKSRDRYYKSYFLRTHGVDPDITSKALADGGWSIIEDMYRHMDERDILYDIGAHSGLYSIFFSHVVHPNQIVAFEPTDIVERLREKAESLDFDLHIINKAISGNTEGVKYVIDEDKPEGGTGTQARSPKEIEVEKMASADILDQNLPLPNVVKIDVDGAELDVVSGLRPLLNRDECRLIYIECHFPIAGRASYGTAEDNFRNWSFDEIIRILRESGFDVEFLGLRANDTIYVKGAKPRLGGSPAQQVVRP